jgi:hypothetical protein
LGGFNLYKETMSMTWYTSARVGGELLLKPQQFSYARRTNTSVYQRPNASGVYVAPPLLGYTTTSEPSISAARDLAYAKAYSRFWEKVKGDTANVGVTAASWQQSWRMIQLNLDRIHSFAKDAVVEANRRGRRGRRLKKERAADLFLEAQFGWGPLFTDVWNTLKVLSDTGGGHPSGWFRGSATEFTPVPDYKPDPYFHCKERSARVRVTINAHAEVSNPNLWLLNRLGLVNPASVLWDRIPWSWVVGLFSNVNSIIGSFSNDFGLSITDVNRTDTTIIMDSTWVANTYPKTHPFYAEAQASGFQRFKSRSLMPALTRPKLQVRLPRVEWGLALIGSSVLYQQVSRLGKPS